MRSQLQWARTCINWIKAGRIRNHSSIRYRHLAVNIPKIQLNTTALWWVMTLTLLRRWVSATLTFDLLTLEDRRLQSVRWSTLYHIWESYDHFWFAWVTCVVSRRALCILLNLPFHLTLQWTSEAEINKRLQLLFATTLTQTLRHSDVTVV